MIRGIRSELGRKSIPNNYEKHASEQIHILDDLFKYKQHMFVTITDKGEPTKSENMWIFWALLVFLIEWVIKDRNYGDSSDYLIKIMGDTGKGFLKICFGIIPYDETQAKPRSTYAEGGAPARGFLDSVVNKYILCVCVPEIQDHSFNFQKIFSLINMNKVVIKYKNVIFTGDLKVLNEIYGSMESSCKHPCIYCTSESQVLESGPLRTLESLKVDYEKWIWNGGNENTCKNYIM